MAMPAENVVAFYNKRGACEQWIKEGKGAIKRTPVVPLVRRQCGPASTSCAGIQSRQLSAHTGDAGANQGLFADEPEGKADQNQRKGREPRSLRCLPDGQGRRCNALSKHRKVVAVK
jgi:hypothetical protein